MINGVVLPEVSRGHSRSHNSRFRDSNCYKKGDTTIVVIRMAHERSFHAVVVTWGVMTWGA